MIRALEAEENDGYEDLEAPDYANAATALARRKEIPDADIDAALARGRGGRAAAQRAGAAGRVEPRVPPALAGTVATGQDAGRGFTPVAREAFLEKYGAEPTKKSIHLTPTLEREARILYQGPPFYSRLQRAIEQTPMQSAQGFKWKGVIAKWAKGKAAAGIGRPAEGISQADYVFAHVDDLENGKMYTKQEVLDYLKANELQVVPITLGDRTDPDPRSDADLNKILEQHNFLIQEPLDDADPLELWVKVGDRPDGGVTMEPVDLDDPDTEIPPAVVDAFTVFNRRYTEPEDDAVRAQKWSEPGGDPASTAK